jgi:hypothetical protein
MRRWTKSSKFLSCLFVALGPPDMHRSRHPRIDGKECGCKRQRDLSSSSQMSNNASMDVMGRYLRTYSYLPTEDTFFPSGRSGRRIQPPTHAHVPHLAPIRPVGRLISPIKFHHHKPALPAISAQAPARVVCCPHASNLEPKGAPRGSHNRTTGAPLGCPVVALRPIG